MHYVELLECKFYCLFERTVMLIAVVNPNYCWQDTQVPVNGEDHLELVGTLERKESRKYSETIPR